MMCSLAIETEIARDYLLNYRTVQIYNIISYLMGIYENQRDG
jgi:hypothetical protein